MEDIKNHPESSLESISGANGFISSLKNLILYIFLIVYKEIYLI